MPAPYSLDLRNKVVEAYESGLGTIEQVSKIFNIGTATLKLYLRRKKQTGSLSPRPATGGKPAVISGKKLDFVCNELSKKPDV